MKATAIAVIVFGYALGILGQTGAVLTERTGGSSIIKQEAAANKPSSENIVASGKPDNPTSSKETQKLEKPEQPAKPEPGKGKKPTPKQKHDLATALKSIDSSKLPRELRDLLKELEESKRQFSEDQKRLRKEYSQATRAMREKILREAREKAGHFISDQKDRRKEIDQRLRELRRENNKLKDIFDAAKEAADDAKGDPRRGND